MYRKLLFKNAGKSVKDYLLYLVTLTICTGLFYGFLSVSSIWYQPDLGTQYNTDILGNAMKTAICILACILIFLIRYVNRFMLLRRQKQFGLQAVMGMERSTIAWLFFGETFLMGLLALGAGILLGGLVSQFITAMLLHAYGEPFSFSWSFYPDIAGLTILFFCVCFILVGIFNVRSIRRLKVIDMLYGERKNEEKLAESPKIRGAAAMFLLCALIMLVTGIDKMYLYMDSRLPLPVKIMYWGNILAPGVLLLGSLFWLSRKKGKPAPGLIGFFLTGTLFLLGFAASVPVMGRIYYLPLDSGTMNSYLLFLVLDIAFALWFFFYLAGTLLEKMKASRPSLRYKEENLFFFGQILSKLNTSSKTMALIAMTLTFSMCLFLMIPFLIGWARGYLESRSVFSVQMFSDYRNMELDETQKGVRKDAYAFAEKYLKEKNIGIAGICTFYLYLPQKEDFYQRNKYEFPVVGISLSDYNQLRQMAGEEAISLNDREFALQWQSVAQGEKRKAFAAEHQNLETDQGTLTLAKGGAYEAELGEYLYNDYTDCLYILPDTVCEGLTPVLVNSYINTAEPLPYEKALELQELFSRTYPQSEIYDIRIATLQINQSITERFVFQCCMTYGALVLLVICLTILALQQLTEAGDYAYRFQVLRNMGVESSHINRLVRRQLGFWFGLPVGAAVFCTGIFMLFITQVYQAEITAYVGMGSLMGQFGAVILLVALLLGSYYISAWYLFHRMID